MQNNKKFIFNPIPEPTEKELIDFIKNNPGLRNKSITVPAEEQWAKHLGFNTSYNLQKEPGVHKDKNKYQLQTLLYPPKLEARLRKIRNLASTAIEESGTNPTEIMKHSLFKF